MPEEQQQKWTRQTTWRQGDVFGVDAAAAFGLSHQDKSSETCVVVISHDCDIVHDDLADEPAVEVIVGRIIPGAKGSLEWAKSPRTLHLEMLRSGASVTVELVATDKRSVPKEGLAKFLHETSFALTHRGLLVLRRWLGVRYNRAAFPDVFVNRMGERPHEMTKRLAKVLDRYGKLITAVFFDVDRGREVDRSSGNPYDLSIVLTFDSGEDSEQAQKDAKRAEAEVAKLFEDRLYDREKETWSLIHLLKCEAISEEVLTVAKARALSEWRFEHLSLRADEEQLLPLGAKG